MHTRTSIITGFVALAALLSASPKSESTTDAQAAFARLKTLVGEWEAKTPDGTARLSYELTGAGTVLVERESAEKMPGMMTMFHLDAGRLMLTHYCMEGNQPRMQARAFNAETGEVRFQFLDATNLADPKAGHMHNATFRVLDHDHMQSEWQFYENGAPKMTESFTYTRVR